MEQNVKIVLPKLGESILSATVVRWFKKVGDPVLRDEPLLEVSTDKVNSEIPSPVTGFLSEILAQPDQEIQVGEPLALLSTDAPISTQAPTSPSVTSSSCSGSNDTFLTPAVLRLLQEKK